MAWNNKNESIMPIHQTKDIDKILLPRPNTLVLRSEVRPPKRGEEGGMHLDINVYEVYEQILELLELDIDEVDTIQVIQNDLYITVKEHKLITETLDESPVGTVFEIGERKYIYRIDKAEPSLKRERGSDLVIKAYGCPTEISDTEFKTKLERHGKIASVWRSEIGATGIKNGTRLARMTQLNFHMPWYLTIKGFSFRVKYEGQPDRGKTREIINSREREETETSPKTVEGTGATKTQTPPPSPNALPEGTGEANNKPRPPPQINPQGNY